MPQARCRLHRERNLGQQVEHLLALAQRLVYEVNVDLCLSARCHAVQQHHVLAHHLHHNLVVGIFLCVVEAFYVLAVLLAAIVQSADLALVGVEQLAVEQRLEHRRRAVALVHELLLRYLHHRLRGRCAFNGVPMAQREIGYERLVLLQALAQHGERNVERLFRAIVLAQRHIRLLAWAVAILRLQSWWQRRL